MVAKTKRTALMAVAPDIDLIVEARGQKVILNADLVAIYGVPTKALNQAVKRNAEKFPAGFMFRLNKTEAQGVWRLRSQFVTLNKPRNRSQIGPVPKI